MRREEYYNDEEEAMRLSFDGLQSKIWTAIPAVIVSVNYSNYTITAQPAIQGSIEDENGIIKDVNLPLLINVPVLFASGGGFHITVPITVGDECLIVFSSRCIDSWWLNGGVQRSLDKRMHDLSDGFCLLAPYSIPRTKNIAPFSNDSVTIRDNKNNNIIEMKNNGDINIKHSNNLTINTGANITVNAKEATVNCPKNTINGNLTVNGLITGTGGITVSGGNGANITGDLKTTGDVTAGNISLQGHTHSGVEAGGSNTGVPN